MLWDHAIVKDFAEHLARMGLETCPVCSSGTIGVNPAPVQLPWRGSPWIKPGEGSHDPQANILYVFMVECDFCSHLMLFNSERFTPRDVPSLRPE
jgi:hypothetical protein